MPLCQGPSQAQPSWMEASVSRSAKWRSQTNLLGLLGRERNFIYYKQLCKGPGVVPGLLGGWRYSAYRGEALGRQALLGSCLV